MPNPTRESRIISKPLANLTIATMQDARDFAAPRVAPFVNVAQQEGKYFTYPTGAFNILEMQRRGSSQRAEEGGWTISNDSYKCDRFAVAHLEDWNDLATEDEALDSDQSAADWLANQGNMKLESLFVAECMGPSIWTLDYDGVSGTPSGAQIKQWDQSGSTPQENVLNFHHLLLKQIGKRANKMVVGTDVHKEIVTHSDVRSALQYTNATTLGTVESMLASYFGVDEYIVLRTIYNSAVEGQTASLAFQGNAKDMGLFYVAPNPGKRVVSAAYTFAFNGMGGTNGLVARKYDVDELTSTKREIDAFWDVKVISADAGVFVDDCVG